MNGSGIRARAAARKRGGCSCPPRNIRLIVLWIAIFAWPLFAAEVMPPKPAKFFNDQAGVVQKDLALRLNEQLAQYERDSSNQLLVVVYPKMQTDSSIEDFATRIYHSWGVGTKENDNGAVLFVFVQDRKMRIQTGYGLEASLTDAECFRIIEEMKPFFRKSDYAGGLSMAVSAMIEATKGEYKGTGKTRYETGRNDGPEALIRVVVLLIIIVIVLSFIMRMRQIQRGYVYRSSGRYRLPGDSTWWSVNWGSGGGGGGWSSGDSGGSSWSGGGGDTGGGGASGSW